MEIWKDIEGFEGLYQVSNLGRVKSLERKATFGRSWLIVKEKILKNKGKEGHYHCVNLYNNIVKNYRRDVHRLVAIAFIPNPNNYPLVMHKDDNKHNNSVDNLIWGTHKMNTQDMLRKNRQRNQYTI
jgi:hypothetical protein